jgi:hypothetical protein
MKLTLLPLTPAILTGLAGVARWLPPLQGGGDMFGVSRTIDQAVYTLLNSAAVILWRVNSALISMSLFSYNTQDWLTNSGDGGVWQVMDIVTGPTGLLGIDAWQAMLALALVLFGMSRLLRPFVFFNPVDLGKAFVFGVFAFVVIQQGSGMMRGIESWRSELGSYMYQAMATNGSVSIDMPGVTPSADDPMYAPADLDGRTPIRGWEAVSSSCFLVTDEQELNAGVPPQDFRLAYCLYDPNEPINDQSDENNRPAEPPPVTERYSQAERRAVWQTAEAVRQEPAYTGPDGRLNATGLQVLADRLQVQGLRSFQSDQGQHDLTRLLVAQQESKTARGWGAPEARQQPLDNWLDEAYRSRESGDRGAVRVQEQAQALFGERLSAGVEQTIKRHSRADAQHAVAATRRVAAELPPDEMSQNGRLTTTGLETVKAELPAETAAAFRGKRGEQDLAAL